MQALLTQTQASMDGSTAGHLPLGLPSLSESTQNCCAHKNEVMKTSSPFASLKKRKLQGKNDRIKVLFTFYDTQKLGWRSITNLWRSKRLSRLCQSQVWLASFWVWLEPSLNCFSNFTSLSEIVHSQTMPRFIYHFKIKSNFQPVILSTLFII